MIARFINGVKTLFSYKPIKTAAVGLALAITASVGTIPAEGAIHWRVLFITGYGAFVTTFGLTLYHSNSS